MPDRRQFMRASALGWAFALLAVGRALADGDGGDSGGDSAGGGGDAGDVAGDDGSSAPDDSVTHDQDDMRRARDAQDHLRAVPLSRAMNRALAMVPGQVLNVNLYRQPRGALGYHIVVLSQKGLYVDVYIDAATNNIISRKAR